MHVSFFESCTLRFCDYKLPAKSMQTNLSGGEAIITMKFKRCTVFSNCYIVVTINGKEERINLNLGGVSKPNNK